MHTLPRLLAAVALSAATVAAATLAPAATAAAPSDSHGTARASNADLAALKRQVRALSTPEKAGAAGYVPVSPCVAGPTGGMGSHYLNPALMGQPLDPMRPQVLLFVPDGDGGQELGGVEWIQPDDDQDLSTTGDRPTMFGRGFDGPMPGHGPGEPVHYDLHVWLFTANPDGVFAPFNPRVSC